MNFFKLVSFFFCLLLPHFATATAPISGPDAANLFMDEMAQVLNLHFRGDATALADDPHYTGLVPDEQGGLYFESRAFREATGKELTCFVGAEAAVIHLAAAWEDAAQQIATALESSGRVPYEVRDSGTVEALIFRSPELELRDSYYLISLAVSKEGLSPEIELGYYKQDRTRAIQYFYDPYAKWRLETPLDGSAYWAGIALSPLSEASADIFGTHSLELRSEGEGGVMVLTTGLYPKWPAMDPDEKGGGVQEFLAVRIDDAVLDLNPSRAAYTPDAATLTFTLPAAVLAKMARGRYLQFDLRTCLDEQVQLLFPLKDAIETGRSAETLSYMASFSPLIARVANCDYVGVDSDLEKGVDVNSALPDGRTALHLATALRDALMIDTLGTRPDLDSGARDAAGATSLHMAMAQKESTETLSALLAIGCDPDIRDLKGRTPLMLTIGNPEQMKLLIDEKADVNAADPAGRTPLHYMAGDLDASSEQIDLLIRAGADPDRRSNDGTTPLMAAVENLCRKQVDALLAAGVDLDIRNNDGLTALDIARFYEEADEEKIMGVFSELYSKGCLSSPIEVSMSYEDLAEKLENSSRYGYGVKNRSSETLFVALRILDETDQWVTRKWFRIAPGEEALLARSTNRIFYLYAESESYTWDGTDNYVRIDGEEFGMMEVKVEATYRGKIRYFGFE